jgi:hypothetical protein
MAGTPMLAVFQVDATDQAVKDFGKHVAIVAKTEGGPKYLTYYPKTDPNVNGTENVVYIWFPDGPESASSLQANRNPEESGALIELANKAKGGYKAFGKARLHRVAENGRVAGSPPPFLAVVAVKAVDKTKIRSMKSGLKLLHQAAISKDSGVRYAAHKLGDGEHGVLLYGMDSADALKTEAPVQDKAVDALLKKKLVAALPDGAVKGVKMILEYKPEYSNP